MIYDFQKASLMKRFSAFLLDIILLTIVATLFCFILSVATGYDGFYKEYNGYQKQYEQQYGVSFKMTQEEFNDLDEEQQKNYTAARTAFMHDKAVLKCYNMIVNLTLTILSIGVLLAYIVMEFVIPLFLKNGQTVGKKIFSIAVMQSKGIKVSAVSMFIRTVFGKYAIETMIPLYSLIMLLFNQAGLFTVLLLFALIIAEFILFFVSKTNSFIHDLLSDSVVVDMNTQMIFDSEEAMIAYKTSLHEEQVEKKSIKI